VRIFSVSPKERRQDPAEDYQLEARFWYRLFGVKYEDEAMRHRKLWALCLPFLLVGCIDFGGSSENDEVEILQEEKSPNGKYVASSFSCSGGGAAGYFYFNANLRKVGEELDQLDGLMGKHKGWKAFTDVDVRWIDDENLEVSYRQDESSAYKENNAVKVESKYGIKIHHVIKEEKP
jgi:hypothetical protein